MPKRKNITGSKFIPQVVLHRKQYFQRFLMLLKWINKKFMENPVRKYKRL